MIKYAACFLMIAFSIGIETQVVLFDAALSIMFIVGFLGIAKPLGFTATSFVLSLIKPASAVGSGQKPAKHTLN